MTHADPEARGGESEGDGESGEVESGEVESGEVEQVIDTRGLRCPAPVIELARAVRADGSARVLIVWWTDPAAQTDIGAWARMRGHEALGTEPLPESGGTADDAASSGSPSSGSPSSGSPSSGSPSSGSPSSGSPSSGSPSSASPSSGNPSYATRVRINPRE